MLLATEESPVTRHRRYAGVISRLLQARAIGAIAAIIVLSVIFQVLTSAYLTSAEMAGIFTVAAPLGITGAGVALLMISGEFDLSVGSMFAITPIVMGELITHHSWNIWVAFGAAMVIPIAFGLLHGLITTRTAIPSFITTLGSYFILEGAAFVITGGYPVELVGHPALFTLLGGSLGSSGFSAGVFWMLGITAVLALTLNFTRFGNWSLSAGGRAGIGRALGVPIAKVKTVNFCTCAALAGLAGCISFANVGSAAPGSGANNNLLAIVAAVLGGTSLFGIEGSIIGTMFGAVILGILETGLVLAGAPGNLYEAMIGAILIAAVLVNVRLNRLGTFLARIGALR